MTGLHRGVGMAIAGIFLLVALWGGYAWVRNRHPGAWFWRVLALGQAALLAQIVVGVVLFFLRGGRPWLHYAYGGFPLVPLIFAHRISRKLDGLEWAAFALAGVFIFGLQLRGLMTGPG